MRIGRDIRIRMDLAIEEDRVEEEGSLREKEQASISNNFPGKAGQIDSDQEDLMPATALCKRIFHQPLMQVVIA